MANILLMDIDSKIPNLALMKLSSWHKLQNDHVFLNNYSGKIDKIYISKVFKFSNLPKLNKNIPYEIGGIAVNDQKLPDHIDKLKPDYDLYPSSYSQGRTTTGCFRGCWFCNVIKHEGKIKVFQHPKEFYDHKFNTINLMDNNWLYLNDWFFETSQWIIDNKLMIIEHGLDLRIMDNENVKQLSKVKFYNKVKIAYDNINDYDQIIMGIELMKKYNFNTRSNVLCYVYMHDNSDECFKDAIERINILTKLNVTPFIMFNCMIKPSKRTNAIKRYCNRPQLIWKRSFKEYCKYTYKEIPFDHNINIGVNKS